MMEKATEKFLCQLCDKQFRDKSCLDVHLKRIHEKSYEKFFCDVCWKEFTLERDLKLHMRLHDPYFEKIKCDVCGLRSNNVTQIEFKTTYEGSYKGKPLQM